MCRTATSFAGFIINNNWIETLLHNSHTVSCLRKLNSSTKHLEQPNTHAPSVVSDVVAAAALAVVDVEVNEGVAAVVVGVVVVVVVVVVKCVVGLVRNAVFVAELIV